MHAGRPCYSSLIWSVSLSVEPRGERKYREDWGGEVGLTEGTGYANDQAIARGKLLGEVDLVAGRALDKDLEVRNGVAHTHKGRTSRMKAASGRPASQRSRSETSSESHCFVLAYLEYLGIWEKSQAGNCGINGRGCCT